MVQEPQLTDDVPKDAAGNRNDAVCDHLNRAVSIGGYACVNDILGNRLSKGSESYSWDALNRMTSYTGTGPMVSYLYRADGMRVRKASSSGSTVYRYDGQMGMQDVSVVGGDTTVTDYGLGARGIDSILTCVNGGQTTTAYPIYDAHGNMISTLTKVDGGGYSYSPLRTYDAWGVVRSGATTGDPKGRYCANLGHKQDDESCLIYMRARYYEPSSGRFLSEDPGRHGGNWFAYCKNQPVSSVDKTGESDDLEGRCLTMAGMFILFTVALALVYGDGTAALAIALTPVAMVGIWVIYTGEDKLEKPSWISPGTAGILSKGLSVLLTYYSGMVEGAKTLTSWCLIGAKMMAFTMADGMIDLVYADLAMIGE